jgi:hypothetical protein
MRLRRPFRDVIGRQLELFVHGHAGLLEQIADARRAYDDAGREDAEQRFAEYQAWASDATDALIQMRDAFAATLDDVRADEYAAEFNRAVRRRFADLALELEEQTFEDL